MRYRSLSAIAQPGGDEHRASADVVSTPHGQSTILALARSGTLSPWVASYAFLASYVQCGSANGATRPDPARRQHLGGLARGARRGVGSAQRETPHLE